MSTSYVRLGWLLFVPILYAGNMPSTKAQERSQNPAQQPPRVIQPAWVFQVQPMGQMLAMTREAIRRVGKKGGDQEVKSFDEGLKNLLGDKGFAGLDLNRPWGGLGLWRDKPENAVFVLILPITSQEAFLDLLQRLKIRWEKEAQDPLVYKVDFPDDFPLFFDKPKTSSLRFIGENWAYLIINSDQPWPAAAWPAPEDLWKERPQALASIRLYPGRVPQPLIKTLIREIENGVADIRASFAGDAGSATELAKVLFDGIPAWAIRNIQNIAQEAEEIEAQVRWELNDPGGQFIFDVSLRPKVGTLLSRAVQQRGRGQQRFAGLAQLELSAMSLMIQPPQFSPEWRKFWSTSGDVIQKELKELDLPKEIAEALLEIARNWQRDGEAGTLEGALLLRAPDAKGHYSAALVWSCAGSRTVEKALHKVARQRAWAPFLQMDVGKAGEWTIHRLKIWPLLPAEVRDRGEQLFGEDPAVYFACGPDALSLAAGSEALTVLQQISQLQPATGAAFEWYFRPKHLTELARILTGDEELGEQLQDILGTEKNKVIGLQVHLDGGEQLRLTIRCHDRILLTILSEFFAFRQ